MSKRSVNKAETRRLLRVESVKAAEGPGERRDALEFRATWGRTPVPRPSDFIQANLWVDDKKTGLPIQWVFNRPQRLVDYLIWRAERDGRMFRSATLKSRQWGISSYWIGKGIERCLRTDHARCAIVADKDETAAALLDRGKLMLGAVPYDLPLVRNNKTELHFAQPFSSRLTISSARRQHPLRGQTVQFAHCTEMPFWSEPEKKLRGINQAVPKAPGTVLSHEFTANGLANFGYHFWWDAKKRKNEYLALFFPWWMDPAFDFCMECTEIEEEAILDSLDAEEQYLLTQGLTAGQLKWRRNTISNECFGDIDSFHQEYPSTPDEAFLASGRPVFPPRLVLEQKRKCEEPAWRGIIDGTGPQSIKFFPERRGGLSIWKEPRKDRNYVIAVDPGAGIQGGDPSAFVIIEIFSGAVVATYNEVSGPEIFGKECSLAGWHYNNAYAMPEITGIGRALLTAMRDFGYTNIAWQPTFDKPNTHRQARYGWSTDHASKSNLVLEGRSLLTLRDDCPPIRDERILDQANTYEVDSRGHFNAPRGKHDDLLMAFLIAHVARRDVIANGHLEVLGKPKPDESFEARHWREFHRSEDTVDDADEDHDYLENLI